MKTGVYKKALIVVLAFALLAVIGYCLTQTRSQDEEYVLSSNEPPKDENIIVTLSGEVKRDGEYSVPFGSTIHECIYAAGGITPEGDLSGVALEKRMFSDGTIHIPKKVYVPKPDTDKENSSSAEALCNINTAEAEELMELPSIGETLAQRIINYRQVNGPFESIEDIKNVSGIGTKTYEQIKNKITVGG